MDDDGRCPEWNLDVFVSFRGEELRNSFASHLFRALENAGIECFRDDDERDIGEKVDPKLVDAIRRSRVSIALFSPRYGESRWCLNELVEMLEFHEKNKHCGHVFMPVFYKVRTGDVRKQTGRFGRHFKEYCEEICADDSQIETWKTALREAGSTSGWRLSERSEAEFIDKIVDHLSSNVLRSSCLCVPEDVVPIESQVEHVMSLLKMSPENCDSPACVVGIHGNRGTGKTTLAGMVFDRVCFGFEGFSFLQLDDDMNRDNLVYLQRKLLLDAFKITLSQFHDLRSNENVIKRKLRCRKLLLVLDNVTCKDQVRHFGVDNQGRWLSRGSRVIITTRHRHVLEDLCVDEKCEVKKMSRGDSLRLFSRRVFGSDHPNEGFVELCESILDISNVRPSDLVDLASVLSGIDKGRWSEWIEKWKKKRKVFCRDLMKRVLLERPIPCGSSFNVAYPFGNAGRMAFLSKPICDFLNVNNSLNGFTTLLIGRPGGQILVIPLPNLGGIIDTLSETWVAPSNGIQLAEKAEQRNHRFNAMQTWISLFRKMGIVEPRVEAARVIWEQTNKASPLRHMEDVGAQSNIPEPFQNSVSFQEEESVADPTLQSEEVLNEADSTIPSEKVEVTFHHVYEGEPSAESTSTPAVKHEYIPRVYARDRVAGPLSNHAQQITTLVRRTSSPRRNMKQKFQKISHGSRSVWDFKSASGITDYNNNTASVDIVGGKGWESQEGQARCSREPRARKTYGFRFHMVHRLRHGKMGGRRGNRFGGCSEIETIRGERETFLLAKQKALDSQVISNIGSTVTEHL